MTRGTNPTCTLTLPVDTSTLKTVRVTFAQGWHKIFKTGADLTMEGNIVKVDLTQEETLSFADDKRVEVQLKALSNTGKILISNIHKDYMRRCIDEEVLV